jgi:multicomponent Na+:H+ antiporter subunit D
MYKEAHVKRALVYSTISNLSYIVLAISIMSPAGLAAGLAHMIFHGITKVVLFFCIGIMFAKWGLEYKNQLYGTGKRAPLMYTAFIIASLSMIGFPLMPGFLGKWHVVRAGMELFSSFGYVGVAAIAYSTVVTALYLIPIAMHAFLAGGGHEEAHAELKHSGLEKERFDMLLFPTIVIVLAIIYFGLFSLPLFYMLGSIAGGLN